MRTPITIVIPVLLVVSTIITSYIMYVQNVESTDKNIRAYALQELKLDVTRLQNILYNLLSENKLADARVNLSVTAMNPAMQALVLANDSNVIIAANRYIWNDSTAKDVVDYNNKLADDVKRTNKPLIFFNENKNYILQGYYPVVLKLENNTSSGKKLGILFAEVNIKNKLINAQNKALNQSVIFTGSMLITSLFVAVLLHFLISRRLNTLALASQNIAKGHYDTNVSVSGNDEITHLAKSYNHMIHQLNEAFDLRDKSKTEIVSLNEKLEDRIQERTELLKQAQHIAKIGNWILDVKENSLYCSDEIYTIFGLKQEISTLTYKSFLSVVHPEDVTSVEQGIENAFKNNENFKVEHRIIMPDGAVHWVREEAIPELDSDGNRIKMTGILQDITNEKNDIKEKEKLERELQQMQKMESLGQLTGGIAHDFNNMLAVILGYNELAQAVANDNNDEKLAKYLGQIEGSSKRASELVDQMSAFSRLDGDVTKKENISLVNALSEISSMLKPLLSSRIILNIQNIDNEYNIQADAVMLNQMLVNLCINAKDAMQDGQGNIDVEVNNVTLNEVSCSSCFKLISGNFIQISVKDNGVGISEEALHRIFEPFFTTKEVGKGTGMGLSMVHGIMHKHHGHLMVDSKEGLGSTFKLLFPVPQKEIEKKLINDDSSYAENVAVCQGNILIVDDEVAISFFLKEYLEDKGYKVTMMNDSREALEYFFDHNKEIDLVISDYTMPGMTGFQLAERMQAYDADVPVILCSGYSEDINKNNLLNENIKSYIEKPINTDLLLSDIKVYIRSQKNDS